MARVKGTAVQSSLRYVRERFGEAPLAAILDALGEADRRALESVLASAWYEVGLFLRFMVEAERSPEFIIGRAARVFSSYYRGRGVCRFEGDWDA